jgi:hypothetical protein
MKIKLLALVGAVAVITGCGTSEKLDRRAKPPAESKPASAAMLPQPPYLGQPVPGLTPERFAPGIVCTDAIELNGVFSPDGREFYFTRLIDGVDTMHQIVFADGEWGEARELMLFPNNARVEAADMVLSSDAQELYFLAKYAHAGTAEKPNYDIWVSRRVNGVWSLAELVPPPVSTAADELYPVFGADGSLYISSNRGGDMKTSEVYRAQRQPGGGFQPPVKAGHPFQSNDGDMCIAPDGSFIVLSAQRPRVGGSYKNDLHVSFRRADGTWEDFVRLDDTINTQHHEWCPMITPDGKYLLFSRRFGEYDKEGWEGTTDGEVYWVDVSTLDKYRSANR